MSNNEGKKTIIQSLLEDDSVIFDIGCSDSLWLMEMKSNTGSIALAFPSTKDYYDKAIDMFYADIDVDVIPYTAKDLNIALYENSKISLMRITHLVDKIILSLCETNTICNINEIMLPNGSMSYKTWKFLQITHELIDTKKKWELWRRIT